MQNYWHLLFYFRYIKVCRPLNAQRLSTKCGVKIQLIIVVLISLLIELPRYFEYRIQKVTISDATYYFLDSTELWDNFLYQLLYKTIAMVVFRRIVPISVTLLLTILLVRNLYHRRDIRNKMFASQRDHGKSGNTVTTVLIITAICFIICHTPGAIYPIFRITMNIPAYCDHFYTYFSIIADMLSVLNSGLNFFIYYPAIPSFRRRLLALFRSCIESNDVGPLRSSEMFTIDSTSPAITAPEQDSK